ncbi:MAG: hypothetical protein DRP02_11900 [Candidatus Gerdarchaeota archaeon]|nr:MAG: hypothetical protein DRP02_11900 [Candidatus Gerdarchaeota archaeon]
MLRKNVETWKGQYTLRRGDMSWTNIVRTEKLSEELFLEFGRRKGENYEYVSLMQGDYREPKKARQLFFAHEINGKWYVYDASAIKFVEEAGTKEKAVRILREIAEKIEREE